MEPWPRRKFLLGGAAAILCASAAPALPWRRTLLAIAGAAVIDPSSAAPAAPVTLIADQDRILAIGRDLAVPSGAAVLDARGKYLLPGLWDMHAHLAALDPIGGKPEDYVGHGVLGVRDMGGFLDRLLALKADLAGGRVGPDLVLAGPTLNGRAFADFHRVVATEADGRAAVRDLALAGVDLIKVHRATTPPVFAAIIDEARRVGLPVGGHVPLGLSWVEASDAGFYSIEHVQTIVENLLADRRHPVADIPAVMTALEGSAGDEIFAALARNGTFFAPTLIAYEASIGQAAPALAAQRRALYERLKPIVGRAHRAGVPILAGTDLVDRPGARLLDELDRLVESGLTPAEAVKAATATAARAVGRPHLARIAPGSPASLLVLDADPMADVRNLRRLSAVLLRGRLIEAPELARLRAAGGESPA